MSSKINGVLSESLENILRNHAQPPDEIAQLHDSRLKSILDTLENELPIQSILFKNCSAEIVGSSGCTTKTGDADEYEINVIIDLPFGPEELWLSYDESWPKFGNIEVTDDTVHDLVSNRLLSKPTCLYTKDHASDKHPYDIFVRTNGRHMISSQKVQSHFYKCLSNLSIVKSNEDVDHSRSSRLSGFDSRFYQNVIIVENSTYGFDYFIHNIKYKLDISCSLRVPTEVFMSHPTIPATLDSIQSLIPDNEDTNFAIMVPKTSLKFQMTKSQRLQEATDEMVHSRRYLGLTDWRFDFHWLENTLMSQFPTSTKCWLLLEYFTYAHGHLKTITNGANDEGGLWSYYLKVIVMRTILDIPEQSFWDRHNLFQAFLACCDNLKKFLSDNPCLLDMFDEKLKLLEVDEYEGPPKAYYQYIEDTIMQGFIRQSVKEASVRLVRRRQYIEMQNSIHQLINRLKDYVSDDYIDDNDIDDEEVTEYVVNEFFRIGSNRVQTWFLNVLHNGSISDVIHPEFGGLVAKEEERLKWDPTAEWRIYMTENSLKEYILSARNVKIFREYLHAKTVPRMKCKFCGSAFDNLIHVFWSCSHVSKFWKEYAKDPKVAHQLSSTLCDKTMLKSLLILSNEEFIPCHTRQNKTSVDIENTLQILFLAKQYLLVCYQVGVKPLYKEHCVQKNASLNRKKIEHLRFSQFTTPTTSPVWGHDIAWSLGCPRPPLCGSPIILS